MASLQAVSVQEHDLAAKVLGVLAVELELQALLPLWVIFYDWLRQFEPLLSVAHRLFSAQVPAISRTHQNHLLLFWLPHPGQGLLLL